MFSPTAVKFHYIFNLRDLSNVFQGFLFATNDCVSTPTEIVRLWCHETQRVYMDKGYHLHMTSARTPLGH